MAKTGHLLHDADRKRCTYKELETKASDKQEVKHPATESYGPIGRN